MKNEKKKNNHVERCSKCGLPINRGNDWEAECTCKEDDSSHIPNPRGFPR